MKGWRTILFNVATLILADPNMVALIPPKYAIPAITIGNLILRVLTTTPIGEKQ